MGLKRQSKPVLINCFCNQFSLLVIAAFTIGQIFATLDAKSKPECNPALDGQSSDCVTLKKWCSYSEEAKRIGLNKFLEKVQDKYHDLHPEELIFRPGGVKPGELKRKFKPYNPDPKSVRRVSDAARNLLKELFALDVNTKILKPREKKAIVQAKHYLENNFGTPYSKDYYSGVFLMGPDLFCRQPICRVGYSDIRYGLANLRVKDLKDVRLVLGKMKLVGKTFSRYIKNMRFGVRAGMVRSTEECLAGIDSFKQSYFQVSVQGEKGKRDSRHSAKQLRLEFTLSLVTAHVTSSGHFLLFFLWEGGGGGISVGF